MTGLNVDGRRRLTCVWSSFRFVYLFSRPYFCPCVATRKVRFCTNFTEVHWSPKTQKGVPPTGVLVPLVTNIIFDTSNFKCFVPMNRNFSESFDRRKLDLRPFQHNGVPFQSGWNFGIVTQSRRAVEVIRWRMSTYSHPGAGFPFHLLLGSHLIYLTLSL